MHCEHVRTDLWTHSAICCGMIAVLISSFLSLIPPCNLTDMNKIKFRAVSDLSCECVAVVRAAVRRGKKKQKTDEH